MIPAISLLCGQRRRRMVPRSQFCVVEKQLEGLLETDSVVDGNSNRRCDPEVGLRKLRYRVQSGEAMHEERSSRREKLTYGVHVCVYSLPLLLSHTRPTFEFSRGLFAFSERHLPFDLSRSYSGLCEVDPPFKFSRGLFGLSEMHPPFEFSRAGSLDGLFPGESRPHAKHLHTSMSHRGLTCRITLTDLLAPLANRRAFLPAFRRLSEQAPWQSESGTPSSVLRNTMVEGLGLSERVRSGLLAGVPEPERSGRAAKLSKFSWLRRSLSGRPRPLTPTRGCRQ